MNDLNGIPSASEQRLRLERLARLAASSDDTCNYGAMLFMERPGDVSFLAPVFPEYRGFEIVSASPAREDGKIYDIWYQGNMTKHCNMTASDVVEWLRKNAKPDNRVMKNIVQWTEASVNFYDAPEQKR